MTPGSGGKAEVQPNGAIGGGTATYSTDDEVKAPRRAPTATTAAQGGMDCSFDHDSVG